MHVPFWDAILPPLPSVTDKSEQETVKDRHEQGEKERARDEFWSAEDEERERKREIIRGMWVRVNGHLMLKRPTEVSWWLGILTDRWFASSKACLISSSGWSTTSRVQLYRI
jgi:hypothetical protein